MAPVRPHDATLRFPFPDERRARLVAEAVGVETGEVAAVDDRSRTSVDREGRVVVVSVEARDLVALRAACGTWTRLVGVGERVVDGM